MSRQHPRKPRRYRVPDLPGDRAAPPLHARVRSNVWNAAASRRVIGRSSVGARSARTPVLYTAWSSLARARPRTVVRRYSRRFANPSACGRRVGGSRGGPCGSRHRVGSVSPSSSPQEEAREPNEADRWLLAHPRRQRHLLQCAGVYPTGNSSRFAGITNFLVRQAVYRHHDEAPAI